jgi:hypothetical protein
MRRLPLLAAVAVVLGVFASSAAVRTAAKPQLASAATPEHLSVKLPATEFSVRKVGDPIVKKVSGGWKVVLRFTATSPADAVVHVARDGRQVQTFKFTSGTGVVTIGPFLFATAGKYRFVLHATNADGLTRALTWNACIACGQLRPPADPLRSLGPAHVVRTDAGWKAMVSFETASPGTATIRLLGKGRTLTTYTFRPKAGRVDVGPFVIPEAGRYKLVLRLTDPGGKTRGLTWPIVAA